MRTSRLFGRGWRARKNQLAKHENRLALEFLEDRTLLANGQWVGVFGGLTPGETLTEQAQ